MARGKQGAKSSGRNQLRIIAGQWRGRRLDFPNVEGLRPTPDRVRETLFNWLQPLLPGARCLDLFCGSGALGLEALSRGAAEAVAEILSRKTQSNSRVTVSSPGSRRCG